MEAVLLTRMKVKRVLRELPPSVSSCENCLRPCQVARTASVRVKLRELPPSLLRARALASWEQRNRRPNLIQSSGAPRRMLCEAADSDSPRKPWLARTSLGAGVRMDEEGAAVISKEVESNPWRRGVYTKDTQRGVAGDDSEDLSTPLPPPPPRAPHPSQSPALHP
jgi:hypothetical protein